MDAVNEYARFARDLARAALVVAGEGEAAAALVGRGALVTAKRNAPVDSGDLRRGIRLVRKGETSIVESDQYYSAFQEFGTSTIAPHPFIGRAVEEWGPRLVKEVEKVRDKAVRDL